MRRVRLFLFAGLSSLALIAGSAPAAAQTVRASTKSAVTAGKPARSEKKPKKAPSDKGRKRGPQSVGSPNGGRLERAVRLRPGPGLTLREGAHTWGVPALSAMIRRAASHVASKVARSRLLVGDMSARGGGPLPRHNSHQSGRDVDLGFYVTNSKGKPVPTKRFVPFDGEGHSRDVEWMRFDDARNWMLVEALLRDQKANVRYIFVSSPLRARLLTYARRRGVSSDLWMRAASTLMSPKDVDVHDDHFHVRIRCPKAMKECIEESSARAVPDASETAFGDPLVAPATDAPPSVHREPPAPADAAPSEVPTRRSEAPLPKAGNRAPAADEPHGPEPL